MLKIALSLEQEILAECNNNGPEALKIVQTLQKIIANIVKDSYDIKFRTLKKSNARIYEIIYCHPACMKFAKAIGFMPDGETLYMHAPEIH